MSTKRKLPAKLGQPMVRQSAKVVEKGDLDESKTVVSGGGNAIKPITNGSVVVSISSDSSSAEEDDESADEQDEAQSVDGDVAMGDTREEPVAEDNEDGGEPSFGDIVKANAAEPIDVAEAFDDPSARALTYPQGAQIQPPSGASLGTVLTQALRTNDVSLLESCLHTTDVNTIRATIQRLDSPLAGTLLQKLAERLHRRPGRAGSLMVWVQWTLVTHGGYLATQRDLIKKLAELNKVIDERARGLQSLLSVKGKLDMLEAQIELRRSMQNHRRRLDEEDKDEDVIYVEGQESGDEETMKPRHNGNIDGDSDGESDISDEMPMTNGVIADSGDEESEEDDELIEDEAEETDEDSGDEDEVDHDDQDSQGEDEESDDGAQAAPPTKIQKTSGSSRRR